MAGLKPRVMRRSLGVFAVGALLFVNSPFLLEAFLLTKPYQASENEINLNIMVALNALTDADASLAVFHAGSVPYYTGKPSIDCLGKCDKRIAHLPPDISGAVAWNRMKSVPGHNKYDLDYSYKQLHPVYVELLGWGKQDMTEWVKNNYTLMEYKGVSIYLRNDSPAVRWEQNISLRDSGGKQR